MSSFVDSPRLPVIDLSLFDLGGPWRDHVAAQVDWAAAEFGVFHVIGHGIEPGIPDSLLELSSAYFRRAPETKHRAHLYFGEGLAEDQPRAKAHTPLQPRNEFPALPGFREAVLDYMSALTGLAHRLMTSFGRGLRLGDNFFVDRYTADPATRLRIFHYPGADADGSPELQGLAGQSDAGLLTLLHQDDVGGLQVRYGTTWLDVPHVAGSFLIAVGDALESLTSGRYAAAVHRVINRSTRARVALPFSFAPRAGAELQPIPLLGSATAPRAATPVAQPRATASRA
jgi:polar amino acid transport system ATP-binding protein